jgi:hypothetical protein
MMTEQRLQEMEMDFTDDDVSVRDYVAHGKTLIAEVRRVQQQAEQTAILLNNATRLAGEATDQRDAALAERDALKADLKLTQGVLNAAQHRLIVWGCRDGHDEDGCPLCSAEHALLNTRESLTEARRVLREVEWAFDNGYDSEDACALCHQPRSTGHLSDCALAAVLAQEEK